MKCENCFKQTTKLYTSPEYPDSGESYDMCEHCAYKNNFRSECKCRECQIEEYQKVQWSIDDAVEQLNTVDTYAKSPDEVKKYVINIQKDLEWASNYMKEINK